MKTAPRESAKPENVALEYIRKNVTLDRIREVEEALSDWGLPSVEKYFDEVLMESVYRGHKGSYKIDNSKARGEAFLGFILCLLFGEPKIQHCNLSRESENRIRRVLKNRFEKDSYFLRYALTYLDTKIGDRNEKTG